MPLMLIILKKVCLRLKTLYICESIDIILIALVRNKKIRGAVETSL